MESPEAVTLIVDGANVMGSRPDGWWRDRAGAITRLHARLAALAARGVGGAPPDGDAEPEAGPGHWTPRVVLVVEGRAKSALSGLPDAPGVEVVGAPGEGDDEIAALAATVPGPRFVVTADRELIGRCRAAGAGVLGPRWLLARLAD